MDNIIAMTTNISCYKTYNGQQFSLSAGQCIGTLCVKQSPTDAATLNFHLS